jgi:hypothetical protein
MTAPGVRRTSAGVPGLQQGPARVAFIGPATWLEVCAPPAPTDELVPLLIAHDPAAGVPATLARLADFAPSVTVVLDPPNVDAELLQAIEGVSLGVLVGALPAPEQARALGALDRVLSFRPALTGARLAGKSVWRAIPPPVSDAFFGSVRPLHGAARVMTIGRPTPHREAALIDAKHHHDVLTLHHGVGGALLREFLCSYDVGVYVAPARGGGYGAQVGMHLAAGQLLLSETLVPAHGLERDIDYLQIRVESDLVAVLDRLNRFPEMYQRIRVRGRLKAEQYRSSRLFGRLAHDVLADVATFG